MDTHLPQARAAVATDSNWETALHHVISNTSDPSGREPDAAILFVTAEFADQVPTIVRRVWRETRANVLIGCSAIGVIGPERELERLPALSLLTLSLPGGTLTPVRLTQPGIETTIRPQDWHTTTGVAPEDVSGWLLFADPFHLDAEAMIAGMAEAYPAAPIVGGLASPGPLDRRTWVFQNGDALSDGAVGLAIGGDYALIPVVSQGADPIGETWTITSVQDHWVETISNRPAVEVLIETLQALPEYLQTRAQQNLLVGIAADEYRHDFRRGDFLVRNLVGIDRTNGSIAIGALPRIGQTIQFHLRDAAAADLDLNLMLDDLRSTLSGRKPIAAILNSCNGRGVNLFGVSHHDAGTVGKKLGPVPLAGLFCAGEIGPIGLKTYLHGFTASLGIIARRSDAS